jgi:predicted membrane-bound spermidine synthase
MRLPAIAALLLLAGCHNRLRLASPQIQRYPQVTCIVLVQTDQLSAELARNAMDTCKDAIERRRIR